MENVVWFRGFQNTGYRLVVGKLAVKQERQGRLKVNQAGAGPLSAIDCEGGILPEQIIEMAANKPADPCDQYLNSAPPICFFRMTFSASSIVILFSNFASH